MPLSCIFFTFSASADDLVYEGHYAFSWSGLRLGKLHLQMQQNDGDYSVLSHVKTAGLLALFSKHKSTTKVEGKIEGNGFYPIHYRSDYRSRDIDKSIELKYDESGKVTKEEVLPWRGARPDVPEELKTGSADSLTAIFAMRKKIRQALESGETEITVPVFDGIRRFDLRARVIDTNKSLHLNDKQFNTVKLGLKRIPLGGFKDKELKKMAEGEPELEFFIEKDHFTLLGFQLELYGGTVMAWLKNSCANEECASQTANLASK